MAACSAKQREGVQKHKTGTIETNDLRLCPCSSRPCHDLVTLSQVKHLCVTTIKNKFAPKKEKVWLCVGLYAVLLQAVGYRRWSPSMGTAADLVAAKKLFLDTYTFYQYQFKETLYVEYFHRFTLPSDLSEHFFSFKKAQNCRLIKPVTSDSDTN